MSGPAPPSPTEATYPGRVFMAFDRFLNALVLFGSAEQSISEHAAADETKQVWACVLCRWLSLTVEKNHCAHTRVGIAISARGGLWAALQLALVTLASSAAFWWFVYR